LPAVWSSKALEAVRAALTTRRPDYRASRPKTLEESQQARYLHWAEVSQMNHEYHRRLAAGLLEADQQERRMMQETAVPCGASQLERDVMLNPTEEVVALVRQQGHNVKDFLLCERGAIPILGAIALRGNSELFKHVMNLGGFTEHPVLLEGCGGATIIHAVCCIRPPAPQSGDWRDIVIDTLRRVPRELHGDYPEGFRYVCYCKFSKAADDVADDVPRPQDVSHRFLDDAKLSPFDVASGTASPASMHLHTGTIPLRVPEILVIHLIHRWLKKERLGDDSPSPSPWVRHCTQVLRSLLEGGTGRRYPKEYWEGLLSNRDEVLCSRDHMENREAPTHVVDAQGCLQSLRFTLLGPQVRFILDPSLGGYVQSAQREEIRQLFLEWTPRPRIEIHDATEQTIRESLSAEHTIIHIGAHCDGINLTLRDGTFYPLEEFVNRAKAGGVVRRPLMVLNACNTVKVAQELATAGVVATAIGVKGSVPEELAREFDRVFYRALILDTLPVSEACARATQRLARDNTSRAFTYHFYASDNAVQHKELPDERVYQRFGPLHELREVCGLQVGEPLHSPSAESIAVCSGWNLCGVPMRTMVGRLLLLLFLALSIVYEFVPSSRASFLFWVWERSELRHLCTAMFLYFSPLVALLGTVLLYVRLPESDGRAWPPRLDGALWTSTRPFEQERESSLHTLSLLINVAALVSVGAAMANKLRENPSMLQQELVEIFGSVAGFALVVAVSPFVSGACRWSRKHPARSAVLNATPADCEAPNPGQPTDATSAAPCLMFGIPLRDNWGWWMCLSLMAALVVPFVVLPVYYTPHGRSTELLRSLLVGLCCLLLAQGGSLFWLLKSRLRSTNKPGVSQPNQWVSSVLQLSPRRLSCQPQSTAPLEQPKSCQESFQRWSRQASWTFSTFVVIIVAAVIAMQLAARQRCPDGAGVVFSRLRRMETREILAWVLQLLGSLFGITTMVFFTLLVHLLCAVEKSKLRGIRLLFDTPLNQIFHFPARFHSESELEHVQREMQFDIARERYLVVERTSNDLLRRLSFPVLFMMISFLSDLAIFPVFSDVRFTPSATPHCLVVHPAQVPLGSFYEFPSPYFVSGVARAISRGCG